MATRSFAERYLFRAKVLAGTVAVGILASLGRGGCQIWRGYRDLNAVLEKGWEEGREEGKVALVLLQLQRVLGKVPEDIRHRIGHLGRDDLDRLASDLLDFSAPGDLTAWLERARCNVSKHSDTN